MQLHFIHFFCRQAPFYRGGKRHQNKFPGRFSPCPFICITSPPIGTQLHKDLGRKLSEKEFTFAILYSPGGVRLCAAFSCCLLQKRLSQAVQRENVTVNANKEPS